MIKGAYMFKFLEDAYTVAVCEKNDNNVFKPGQKFHIIKNGFTFWTADPFPIEINGELYIFAEIWQYRFMKGCIGYTKQTTEGFTKWKIVISEPFHLSYPNIVTYNNKIYICPESNESKQIYLYECIDFPNKWRKVNVLFEGERLCDTTFCRLNDSIYGFTYSLNLKDKNNPLKVFKLHKDKIEFSSGNIKSIGKDYVRPGGKIYYDKYANRVLRVVQIGEPSYGSGILFTNYTLNWPDFYEKESFRIYPSFFNYDTRKAYTGLHTFNITEHYVVIDLKWHRINFIEVFWKSIRKIKKIMSYIL